MIEVVGHTAIDHISKVSHLPGPNASTTIVDRKIYFGGGAANIAAGIAVLGEKVSLVSAVGGDFAGSDYDKWMDKLGIIKRFYTVPEAHTATAFLFTDGSGDQMTFFEWGASQIFESEEPPAIPFVHMATADPGFNVRVAERSEFASFDPGQDIHRYTKEHLMVILDNINILIANQHEFKGMCRTMAITKDELVSRVPLAIETLSSEGCILYQKGEKKQIPSVQVECQDPTGAGDGFRAGFLSAYVRGYDPVVCCKIGTVTASFIVEAIGCQTTLADWSKMADRYTRIFGPLGKPGN